MPPVELDQADWRALAITCSIAEAWGDELVNLQRLAAVFRERGNRYGDQVGVCALKLSKREGELVLKIARARQDDARARLAAEAAALADRPEGWVPALLGQAQRHVATAERHVAALEVHLAGRPPTI